MQDLNFNSKYYEEMIKLFPPALVSQLDSNQSLYWMASHTDFLSKLCTMWHTSPN